MRAVGITTREGPDVAVPVRVEFLLTRDELIDALAWDVRHMDVLPSVKSRKEAMARIVASIREAGEQHGLWHEYTGLSEAEVQEWAAEIVDRCFGPLFDAARQAAKA